MPFLAILHVRGPDFIKPHHAVLRLWSEVISKEAKASWRWDHPEASSLYLSIHTHCISLCRWRESFVSAADPIYSGINANFLFVVIMISNRNHIKSRLLHIHPDGAGKRQRYWDTDIFAYIEFIYMYIILDLNRYVLEWWLLIVSEYFERDGQSGQSRMLTWWFRLRTIRVMHWTRIQACGAITWNPWETERSTWIVVGVAIQWKD